MKTKKWIKGKTVRLTNLVSLAKDLKSEEGENIEYDRALVELVNEAIGYTQEDLPRTAILLGISIKNSY